MILGVDISHWQGSPNFDYLRSAGTEFCITKLTEGTTYRDPTSRRNRSEAKRAGMISGIYHFAKAGNAIREADFFVDTAGDVSEELLVLDWEVKHADPVGWCLTWLNRVFERTGCRPLIYINKSTRNGFNWSPVIAGNFGLWLASYDGVTDQPAANGWAVAMKQYTSSGRVAGIAGDCDRDAFYGTVGQLRKYTVGGAATAPSAPAPPPLLGPVLLAGQTLRPREALVNGGWVAVMQDDGNFVVYANGKAQWSTRTSVKGSVVTLQSDGNLVVYTPGGKAVWASHTEGKGGQQLEMQSDGNLVIYTANGRPVWDRI